MSPATHPNDSRPSLDLVRGIFSMGAIALLLVGVPLFALPRLGWPLPHGMPAPADMLDALVHRGVSFSVLLRGAAAVLWLAWGVLAACIVIEAVAWARRREARRLSGVGGVQRLAATLVATAVLVLPSLHRLSARPASAMMLPLPRSPSANVTAMPMAWIGSPTQDVSAPPETPGEQARVITTAFRPYVVQRYDCLWDIAERHLGDPYRWPEIAALTAGVVQPDGHTLGDPNLIYPGWTVLLPPDAAGLDGANRQSAPRPEEPAVVVGTTSTTTTTVITPRTPTAVAPTSTTTSRSAERPAGRTEKASGPSRATAVALSVGVPSLLAGIFVWRMRRAGLAAHRRRRRGQALTPRDVATEPTERRVRAIAEVEAVVWVDALLRYASVALADAGGGGVEGILAVRPGALGIELIVDPPATPVGLFQTADGGRTWTLDPAVDLDQLRELAVGQVLAPALCSVGTTLDGPVLVDLEQAGVLSVEGDPTRVQGFLAGAALELASAPWAADLAVYLLGGDRRLEVRDLVEAVPDEHAFVARLDRMSGVLDEDDLDGMPSTLAARVAPGNAEGWFPAVIVAQPGTDVHVLANLAARAKPRSSGLALVAAGPLPNATWCLLVDADGRAVLEPMGMDLDCRVDAEVIAALTGCLGEQAERDDMAPVLDLAAEDEAAELSLPSGSVTEGGEPQEGEVRVLGPVEVTWAAGATSPPDRVSVLAAVVAYLGTHDDRPVPSERLQEAIWPLRDDDRADLSAGSVKETTLRSTVSRARTALGKDSLSRHHLPPAQGGTYRLGPRFGCDWRRFRQLVSAAHDAPGNEAIELYRQALSLVRGRPFEDAPTTTFAWADDSPLVSDIEVAVVSAAEELGERALDAGQPELAAWAALQGLRVVPVREDLYRVRMQASFDAGDIDGIDQAHVEAARAVRHFIDPAEPLQDETERLYQRLKRACRSGASLAPVGTAKASGA